MIVQSPAEQWNQNHGQSSHHPQISHHHHSSETSTFKCQCLSYLSNIIYIIIVNYLYHIHIYIYVCISFLGRFNSGNWSAPVPKVPSSRETIPDHRKHQTTAVAKIFHSDIGSSTTHPNHPAFLLQEVKITGDWHVAYGHQSSAVLKKRSHHPWWIPT